MSWIVLILSGVLEAVWATALGKSEGFTRLGPSVVFGVGVVASMAGLAYAMRELPTGTAYAVWVGIGASLTVLYGMFFGGEGFSLVRTLLVLGIVACVIGLKLVH
ncbi:QacE family quaternary ammonium compound efflux SMR transporter [Rathayibacter tritici]|uniref:Ligand-binding protein SH3 n=1 Tax=Rathayibacter tritici TaxID=33888 RepID=A0A160KVX1_9MICO|nr:multidrug efflux SMR transporter [Rathayibacter tritici]AND17907.1 ligand-binding protein SH3 [Rathayibacter tritici]PPF30541.1 QacE family quaternary ammonium compound efflux SMR transporter [Rathayibacter tritici]PPF66704.1 QacE family quaternary ammonium compound efflux SMR transporter [Rathayibacter tritici]PPG09089.1 QacE family quaternary ammonium compound efflux SMR transporter [Rathayibacter tritici]PPI17839.1 QacE family quaternary ammonium compound efflux SMR transporter [Rathayib